MKASNMISMVINHN